MKYSFYEIEMYLNKCKELNMVLMWITFLRESKSMSGRKERKGKWRQQCDSHDKIQGKKSLQQYSSFMQR